MARALLYRRHVKTDLSSLIGMRHLWSGSRRILVVLTRNEGGSVAAQCFLGGAETPIIDGPTEGVALATLSDALEALLLARRLRSFEDMPRLVTK